MRRLALVDHLQQLRHSARSLGRARVFSIATIATIALAVGAGSAMFTLLNAVLLRPLPYPRSERLVGVWNTFPALNMPLVRQSAGTFDAFRRLSTTLESIAVFTDGALAVTSADGSLVPERVAMSFVSGSLFPMLGVRPVVGRVLNDSDETVNGYRLVVISELYWKTRMNADASVLGRRLRIEGKDFEIVGVVPASFAFPGSNTRIWGVVNVRPDAYLGNFGLRAIGRLRPGVTIDGAQRELEGILQRTPELFPEQRPGVSTATVLAQTKAHVVIRPLRKDAIGGFERVVWLVTAIAAVLVMVAFSNLASLTLGRVEARQREFAIRSTLGASTGRFWWSVFAELAIVSAVGGILGLTVSLGVLAALSKLGPTHMPDPLMAGGGTFMLPRLNEVTQGWTLALAALALTGAFVVVAGAVGAWRVAATDMLRALRDGARGGTAGRASQRLRFSFVALEVALSLVLLSGSFVLARGLQRLLNVKPGFDPSNVFVTWVTVGGVSYPSSDDVMRFYRDALTRIARLPGVDAVGIVSKPPLQFGPTQRPVWVEDAPTANTVLPPVHPVAEASDGYFRAMGIPLVAGQVFDDEHVRRGAREAVVSTSFALRYWGDGTGRRAIGRRFRPYAVGPWLTIVGVVGDVRDTSLMAPPQAAIYLPQEPGTDTSLDTRPTRMMAFVVRTARPESGIGAAIDREIRAIDPNMPTFDSRPMSESIDEASARQRFVLRLLAVGSATTLLLGVIGLYGVIAYAVGLRRREIGIRIALGLTPTGAARMIVRQGGAIIVLGVAMGLMVFWVFARLLKTLTFGVSVVDSASVAGALVTVLVIGTLATWLPARRAASIDPGEALRAE